LGAFISYWKRDEERLWSVNKTGVANIVDACLEFGVEKLVHISSAGAVGYSNDGALATEDTPFNWPEQFYYMHSKRAGQDIVVRAVRERGLNAVILNPAAIMGPGDHNSNTTQNKMLAQIYKKTMAGCFRGGLGVVDVRDLVEIILKALTSGTPGECYLVLGENVRYSTVVKAMGRFARRHVYPFQIPQWILIPTGELLEFISTFTHKRPLITAAHGKMSGLSLYYSNEKSMRYFNYSYLPFEETIRDCCRYFVDTFL
jgi:nucleoside-diphosphate-sugar epimerase